MVKLKPTSGGRVGHGADAAGGGAPLPHLHPVLGQAAPAAGRVALEEAHLPHAQLGRNSMHLY